MKGMAYGMVGLWVLLGGVSLAQAGPSVAEAKLYDAEGQEVGTATLKEEWEAPETPGVLIQLRVSKLSPGIHAFHIHEKGACEAPDFKSAGGHFNPEGKKHGIKNPDGHHAGDLSSITIGPDGMAKIERVARGVTLGPGKFSLLDADGSALVIHADPDDDVTDPAGNAGARIACGVIGGME